MGLSWPDEVPGAGPVTRAVISLALWLLIITFSPVILLAAEKVNRYVMRRVRRSISTAHEAVVRHSGQPARRPCGCLCAPPCFLPSSAIRCGLPSPRRAAESATGSAGTAHGPADR